MESEGPKDFIGWFPKQELEEIKVLLDAKIPDEIAGLQRDIGILAAWQGRCSVLLADAESLLSFAQN